MKLKHIAAAALVGCFAAPAFAVPLASIGGSANWKLTGVTTECLYSTSHPVVALQGAPIPGCSHFGSNESTWGVGRVTTLNDAVTDGEIWDDGENGEFLTYFIYGIADQAITGSAPNFNIYNEGATGGPDADGLIHIDIYQTPGQFAPGLANVANRTGYDDYLGITYGPGSGSLYLSLVLVPGGIDDPVGPDDATLYQQVSASTLPTSGNGFFYAVVTGGSAAAQWNTNSIQLPLLPSGNTADFYGVFSIVNDANSSRANRFDFPGSINDPILSFADAPEPATLALLGLGLAGLALRRRKMT